MAFEIVKAETRTARMLTWFRGICSTVTDLFIGSKIRTKIEAVAVEMEQMDTSWHISLKKAIPVAIYQAFNFSLLPATRATGDVTFTATPAPTTDISIPIGTNVSTQSITVTTEKVYKTTVAAVLPAGDNTVTVPVVSTSVGAVGNTGINTITVMKSTVSGITSVTNLASIANGSDKETEDARRLRFVAYAAALKRGTVVAIVTGAKTSAVLDAEGIVIERVQQAACEDHGTPVGNINCYIYNGTGTTSDALVAQTQKIIDGYTGDDGIMVSGYKAAGVVCHVVKATEIAQDVTVAITKVAGYNSLTVEMDVRDAILIYIRSLGIGAGFVYNELIERIMGVAGVYNCDLTVPAADILPEFNQVVAATGTITVTVA